MTKENQKIAIHCPTEELWERVQRKAFSEGYKWSGNGSVLLDYFSKYKENTCLWIKDSKCLEYSPKDFYTNENYTIIPAEEWLAYYSCTHTKDGTIADSRGCSICPEPEQIELISKQRELIESEDSIVKEKCKCGKKECVYNPAHKVPLREGDKVKLKSYGKYQGNWNRGRNNLGDTIKIGDEGIIQQQEDHKGYLVNFRSDLEEVKSRFLFDYNESGLLQLIPTESDIVVGSVWEYANNINGLLGKKRTIESVRELWWTCVEQLGGASKDFLLKNAKLIHRGDEVISGIIDEHKGFSEFLDKGQVEDLYNNGTPKQTNKKEKKMKRAEKVIALGNPVEDTGCSNQGIVVALYPETNQVSYKDQSDGEILTVHVDRLIQRFKMPKPKPVKTKKKK